MSTIYKDPRQVVVSITMKKGTYFSTWSFRSGNPSPETLASIVAAMVDGCELEYYGLVPIHEIEDHE